MIYQSRFQASEPPSKALVSSRKYSSDKNGFYHLHCHSYYEISFVMKGERYEYFNGKKYRVSDRSFFLIPPLVVHGNENITPVEDIILQFSTSFLSDLSTLLKPETRLSLKGGAPYITLDEDSKAFAALMGLADNSDRYNAMYEKSGFEDTCAAAVLEYRRSGLFLELLAALLESGEAFLGKTSFNTTKIMALDKVINLILDHPEDIPEMNTAAAMTGMSYFNFSRLFKEATQMNYTEYCNAVRIRKAEELLLKSDKPISEIAAEIGIDTPSYFTRLFKQINDCAPAEYRKMYKYS